MLGDTIRLRRHALGLSLSEVAKQIGVSRQYLSEIEFGRLPGISTVFALSDLLTLPTDEWVPEVLAKETRILTLIRLGEQLLDVGDVDHAWEVARRLRGLLRTTPSYHGRVFHLLGVIEFRRNRVGRSLVWFRKAEAAALRGASRVRQGDALYNTGLAMRHANLITQSVRKFERAAVVYRADGDLKRSGYAWLSLANTLRRAEAYREGRGAYRRAVVLLEGDVWAFDAKLGEAICTWQIASVSSGIRALEKIRVPANDLERQGRLNHNLAVAHRQANNLAEAINHISLACAVDESKTATFRGNTLAELCLCLALAGDASGAWRAARTFVAYPGPRDVGDLVAIRLLSLHLGRPVDVSLPSSPPTPNYERRLWATLQLISNQPA